MKFTVRRMTTVAAITLVALWTTSIAQAQMRRASGHHSPGERTSVAAALSPVGAATGWGRITVHDSTRQDTVERWLSVHVYELAPDADFTISVDGVVLGELRTDDEGAAWLALHTDHHQLPPVPADLPPAAALQMATVLDASLAPTLEGTFVTIGQGPHGPGDLVYQERIHLDPVNEIWQRGMARVARDADDDQFFETRGHGLVVGTAYEIRIDGILAGVATADEVGQAWLALSTEDGTLPADLQPIEDLRLVEWTDSNGGVVLSGSFTGDGTVGHGPGHDDPPHGGGGDDPPHGGGGHDDPPHGGGGHDDPPHGGGGSDDPPHGGGHHGGGGRP